MEPDERIEDEEDRPHGRDRGLEPLPILGDIEPERSLADAMT